MPKGNPLIRTRTRQERKRRRLLMTGIPLLAVGVALAWSVNNVTHPKIEQVEQGSTPVQSLAPAFTTAVMANSEPEPSDHSQQDIEPLSNASSSVAELPADKQVIPETETLSTDNLPTTLLSTDTQSPSVTPATAVTEAADNIPPIATQSDVDVDSAQNDITLEPDTDEAVAVITEPEIVTPKPVASNTPKVALPKNFDALSDSRLVKAHAPTVTYVSSQTLAQLAPSNTDSNKPIQHAVNDSNNTERGRRGWIYAGRFSNGTWIERGLLIDNKLPTPGQRYQLSWGAKLRDNPPGRSLNNGNALGDEIGFLNSGKSIQVVQVKNSGNSGHIWLQVRH